MKRTTRYSLSTSLVAAGALVAAAVAGPAAAEPVSAKFDGTYEGSRQLVELLSGEQCGGPKRYTLEVREGVIDGAAVPTAMGESGKVEVRGIVASDGFFTGRQIAGPDDKTLFQGRIEGDVMVGGLLTRGGNCAWIVKLEKA